MTQPTENTAVDVVRDVLDDALDNDWASEGGTIRWDTGPRIVAALIAAGYICHDLESGEVCPRCGRVRLR